MSSKDDIPQGDAQDNDYVSRTGQKQKEQVPVQSDEDPVESGVDPATADSDEQLAKDDEDAIDKSNIIDEKTRGAAPKSGYKEPSEDDITA